MMTGCRLDEFRTGLRWRLDGLDGRLDEFRWRLDGDWMRLEDTAVVVSGGCISGGYHMPEQQ